MKRLSSPFAIAAVIGIAALLALLVYGLAHTGESRSIDKSLANGKRAAAPGFDLPRLDGPGTRTLASYRGKVVVLNFWASWCAPCREESPLLQRWHRRISKDGRATVVGVDVNDVSDDARAFVRKYRLTYGQVRDSKNQVGPDYGVSGVPETAVIDRRGRVAALKRGPVTEAFLRDKVAPLVKAGP